MAVFDNNGFRVGAIVLVLFLMVPFLFPDRSVPAYDDGDPVSISGKPVRASRNPLSKLYNRIGAFYGFAKRAPKKGADGLNAVGKEQAKLPFSKGSESVTSGNGGIPADAIAKVVTTANRPAKVDEYVQIGEKIYDVVTDPAGKKYVLTEKGPVDFDVVMARTLPADDARNLKKYAKGDRSEDVILAYAKYANQGYFDRDSNFVFTGPTDSSGGKYGMYSKQGDPSLFGLGGGFDGSGVPSLWGDEAFNESKTKLSAKYSNTRSRASALSKARTTVAATQASSARPASRGTARAFTPDIPLSQPIIAKLSEGKPKQTASSDVWQNSAIPKKEGDQEVPPGQTRIGLDSFESARNIGDTVSGEVMTDRLLCQNKTNCSFVGEVTEENGKKVTIKDPWAYPRAIKESGPWSSFIAENNGVKELRDNDALNKDGVLTDKLFTKVSEKIKDNKELKEVNIVIVNGKDERTGEPIFLNVSENAQRADDYFPVRIVLGAFGDKGKVISDPAQVDAVADLPNTVYISPLPETTQALRKKNRTVAEHDNFSIDPDSLKALYNNLDAASTEVVSKEKAVILAEQQKIDEFKGLNDKNSGTKVRI